MTKSFLLLVKHTSIHSRNWIPCRKSSWRAAWRHYDKMSQNTDSLERTQRASQLGPGPDGGAGEPGDGVSRAGWGAAPHQEFTSGGTILQDERECSTFTGLHKRREESLGDLPRETRSFRLKQTGSRPWLEARARKEEQERQVGSLVHSQGFVPYIYCWSYSEYSRILLFVYIKSVLVFLYLSFFNQCS